MESLPASYGIVQKSFKPGDILIRQGDDINQAYVIIDGIAKCYIREDNGKDYIFEFLGRGEITGDLEAIQKAPCLCNIEALTAMEVYVLPYHLFSRFMLEKQEFNELIVKELVTRIVQTCRRASYQQLYPVEYGLLRLLMLEADQQISFSKKDMAAYLGISVRSFNRTIHDLRAKNVLDEQDLSIGITTKELEQLLRRFEE
ncbi:MAG TPA: Crp/Fnr family transcriptional regulator [Chitinophaga sp.]|uniref:Crp/Fnr family transcriptional regulator n=1 Tax=Chitinophaga sp. TaxID=1869181 RepID=UPI002C1A4385|nr:Crp/Fnr family transcriptional regulator [Chitinophaga sp.]HVI43474.1 Crp/Fnr family transcriptional regulator [Chitinophaga sp.]